MSDPITLGNFEAVHELTENDNFHTSIYESDYDGLLIARCNQNGRHPHQIAAILNGLTGKQASAELIEQYASRISQQDAELERLQALYDREKAAHRISVDEAIAEARKAAFIEAAEIADGHASMNGTTIAGKIRAKAEETGR